MTVEDEIHATKWHVPYCILYFNINRNETVAENCAQRKKMKKDNTHKTELAYGHDQRL